MFIQSASRSCTGVVCFVSGVFYSASKHSLTSQFSPAESTVQQMKKVIFKLGDPCSALCTNRDGTLLAAVGRRGKGNMPFMTVKKNIYIWVVWTTGKIVRNCLNNRCGWYRIVLGKCPWALAARAQKIGGGWLHGGGA